MKKLIAGTLCLVMLLSFASCTDKNKTEYTRGTWTENVYKSEFLQLSYTLPDTWVRASDEEIDAIMEQSMGLVTDNSAVAEKAAAKSLYEFMVQDPTTGTNISLLVENLAGNVGTGLMTEKSYYEIVKAQMESGAVAGMEFETDGVLNEHTINNNKYYYAKQTVKTQGIEVNQYIILRKVSDYMMVATISAMSGETFEDSVKNFS